MLKLHVGEQANEAAVWEMYQAMPPALKTVPQKNMPHKPKSFCNIRQHLRE